MEEIKAASVLKSKCYRAFGVVVKIVRIKTHKPAKGPIFYELFIEEKVSGIYTLNGYQDRP